MNKKPTTLPSLPGVYLFKFNDEIIYVGKAKNIKKRVATYFQAKDDFKINALLYEHTHVDHIVTHSENDALLLEAQLIAKHQPKFNVLLKNGQPFVFLMFTSGPLPRLEIVRNKKKKATYFGPFLHKKQARSVYQYLLSTFRLNLCKAKIENGCLNYHLGRCAGNCLPSFDAESYAFRAFLSMELLRGNYKRSLDALKEKIKQHMQDYDFEKAKNLHKYEQDLEHIFETLKSRFSERKYATDVFVATTKPIYKRTTQNHDIGIKIKERFNLEVEPATIDCFDISHFQSSYIVGSCVRFTYGVPDKNKFRRFAIKTLEEQNDYAALQEIVARRYRDEEPPDLIVIDGGKGQLHAIEAILPEATIISLAKREETVFGKTLSPEGIKIDSSEEVGKLIIALRDYAHHFAISYHRKKRHMK